MNPRDRLIVALDVPEADAARALVDRLAGHVGLFKIGSQVFTAAGPDLVREIVARGDKVFLDLKFHDIPNTVAGAVASASRLGVSLVDVHGLGGRAMIEAAVGALPAMGTRLLAITILTSHDDGTLDEIGVNGSVAESVRRLAQLAKEAGADGVVASPHEVASDPRGLRERLPDRDPRHPAGGRGPGRPGPPGDAGRGARRGRGLPRRGPAHHRGRRTPRPPPTRSCARWRASRARSLATAGATRSLGRAYGQGVRRAPPPGARAEEKTTRSPGRPWRRKVTESPASCTTSPATTRRLSDRKPGTPPSSKRHVPRGPGLDERRLDPVLPGLQPDGERAAARAREGRLLVRDDLAGASRHAQLADEASRSRRTRRGGPGSGGRRGPCC